MSKIGKHVRITGGMKEFVGQTGTITGSEKDGSTTMYRVQLDEPVQVEGVGLVEDDLWSWDFLEPAPKTGRKAKVSNSDVKYPNIRVQLTGQDGNAFFILGCVKGAMRKGGVPQEEVDAYMKEATSGDYNHLLATTMRWVDAR